MRSSLANRFERPSSFIRTRVLSAVLDKGMRGVSISVTADSASGGFIVPNDHVDLILTRPTPEGQESETLLSNIRVLAINARLGETGKPPAIRRVTAADLKRGQCPIRQHRHRHPRAGSGAG